LDHNENQTTTKDGDKRNKMHMHMRTYVTKLNHAFHTNYKFYIYTHM